VQTVHRVVWGIHKTNCGSDRPLFSVKSHANCKCDTDRGNSLPLCTYRSIFQQGKGKVNYTLVQALRLCTGCTAHRGSRDIALLFLDHGNRRGWAVSVTPSRSLRQGKTLYPLYRRLGGPQGRSGQVRKISPPMGFDPRTVQPVASRYTDWATRPTSFNKTAY